MENARIVFFGTPEFAQRMLIKLINEHFNVVAVVSQPDRPVGRKHVIVPTPVHQTCIDHNIPCLQPEKCSAMKDEILAYKPDLILTCAYGQFLPDSIITIPPLGTINIHPSLLPKYRGGAPIQHAVMNGDTETGVSLMQVIKKMDAGDIYACEHLSIGEDETFEELNERLIQLSEQMIHTYLPKYIAGELPGVPQTGEVVLGLNITSEEEQVHFQSENLSSIYNHIRGLIHWPIAYGMIEDIRVKFYKVRKEVKEINEKPGTILGFKNHAMEVACEGGVLLVYELQVQGKKKMDADAFANGNGREFVGKVFD